MRLTNRFDIPFRVMPYSVGRAVPVICAAFEYDGKISSAFMWIDTGAELTIIPESVIAEIRPAKLNEITLRNCIDKSKTDMYTYDISVWLSERGLFLGPIKTDLGLTVSSLSYGFLGLDILRQFRLEIGAERIILEYIGDDYTISNRRIEPGVSS